MSFIIFHQFKILNHKIYDMLLKIRLVEHYEIVYRTKERHKNKTLRKKKCFPIPSDYTRLSHN